jgi:hypothetical protein
MTNSITVMDQLGRLKAEAIGFKQVLPEPEKSNPH